LVEVMAQGLKSDFSNIMIWNSSQTKLENKKMFRDSKKIGKLSLTIISNNRLNLI